VIYRNLHLFRTSELLIRLAARLEQKIARINTTDKVKVFKLIVSE